MIWKSLCFSRSKIFHSLDRDSRRVVLPHCRGQITAAHGKKPMILFYDKNSYLPNEFFSRRNIGIQISWCWQKKALFHHPDWESLSTTSIHSDNTQMNKRSCHNICLCLDKIDSSLKVDLLEMFCFEQETGGENIRSMYIESVSG